MPPLRKPPPAFLEAARKAKEDGVFPEDITTEELEAHALHFYRTSKQPAIVAARKKAKEQQSNADAPGDSPGLPVDTDTAKVAPAAGGAKQVGEGLQKPPTPAKSPSQFITPPVNAAARPRTSASSSKTGAGWSPNLRLAQVPVDEEAHLAAQGGSGTVLHESRSFGPQVRPGRPSDTPVALRHLTRTEHVSIHTPDAVSDAAQDEDALMEDAASVRSHSSRASSVTMGNEPAKPSATLIIVFMTSQERASSFEILIRPSVDQSGVSYGIPYELRQVDNSGNLFETVLGLVNSAIGGVVKRSDANIRMILNKQVLDVRRYYFAVALPEARYSSACSVEQWDGCGPYEPAWISACADQIQHAPSRHLLLAIEDEVQVWPDWPMIKVTVPRYELHLSIGFEHTLLPMFLWLSLEKSIGGDKKYAYPGIRLSDGRAELADLGAYARSWVYTHAVVSKAPEAAALRIEKVFFDNVKHKSGIVHAFAIIRASAAITVFPRQGLVWAHRCRLKLAIDEKTPENYLAASSPVRLSRVPEQEPVLGALDECVCTGCGALAVKDVPLLRLCQREGCNRWRHEQCGESDGVESCRGCSLYTLVGGNGEDDVGSPASRRSPAKWITLALRGRTAILAHVVEEAGVRHARLPSWPCRPGEVVNEAFRRGASDIVGSAILSDVEYHSCVMSNDSEPVAMLMFTAVAWQPVDPIGNGIQWLEPGDFGREFGLQPADDAPPPVVWGKEVNDILETDAWAAAIRNWFPTITHEYESNGVPVPRAATPVKPDAYGSRICAALVVDEQCLDKPFVKLVDKDPEDGFTPYNQRSAEDGWNDVGCIQVPYSPIEQRYDPREHIDRIVLHELGVSEFTEPNMQIEQIMITHSPAGYRGGQTQVVWFFIIGEGICKVVSEEWFQIDMRRVFAVPSNLLDMLVRLTSRENAGDCRQLSSLLGYLPHFSAKHAFRRVKVGSEPFGVPWVNYPEPFVYGNGSSSSGRQDGIAEYVHAVVCVYNDLGEILLVRSESESSWDLPRAMIGEDGDYSLACVETIVMVFGASDGMRGRIRMIGSAAESIGSRQGLQTLMCSVPLDRRYPDVTGGLHAVWRLPAATPANMNDSAGALLTPKCQAMIKSEAVSAFGPLHGVPMPAYADAPAVVVFITEDGGDPKEEKLLLQVAVSNGQILLAPLWKYIDPHEFRQIDDKEKLPGGIMQGRVADVAWATAYSLLDELIGTRGVACDKFIVAQDKLLAGDSARGVPTWFAFSARVRDNAEVVLPSSFRNHVLKDVRRSAMPPNVDKSTKWFTGMTDTVSADKANDRGQTSKSAKTGDDGTHRSPARAESGDGDEGSDDKKAVKAGRKPKRIVVVSTEQTVLVALVFHRSIALVNGRLPVAHPEGRESVLDSANRRAGEIGYYTDRLGWSIVGREEVEIDGETRQAVIAMFRYGEHPTPGGLFEEVEWSNLDSFRGERNAHGEVTYSIESPYRGSLRGATYRSLVLAATDSPTYDSLYDGTPVELIFVIAFGENRELIAARRSVKPGDDDLLTLPRVWISSSAESFLERGYAAAQREFGLMQWEEAMSIGREALEADPLWSLLGRVGGTFQDSESGTYFNRWIVEGSIPDVGVDPTDEYDTQWEVYTSQVLLASSGSRLGDGDREILKIAQEHWFPKPNSQRDPLAGDSAAQAEAGSLPGNGPGHRPSNVEEVVDLTGAEAPSQPRAVERICAACGGPHNPSQRPMTRCGYEPSFNAGPDDVACNHWLHANGDCSRIVLCKPTCRGLHPTVAQSGERGPGRIKIASVIILSDVMPGYVALFRARADANDPQKKVLHLPHEKVMSGCSAMYTAQLAYRSIVPLHAFKYYLGSYSSDLIDLGVSVETDTHQYTYFATTVSAMVDVSATIGPHLGWFLVDEGLGALSTPEEQAFNDALSRQVETLNPRATVGGGLRELFTAQPQIANTLIALSGAQVLQKPQFWFFEWDDSPSGLTEEHRLEFDSRLDETRHNRTTRLRWEAWSISKVCRRYSITAGDLFSRANSDLTTRTTEPFRSACDSAISTIRWLVRLYNEVRGVQHTPLDVQRELQGYRPPSDFDTALHGIGRQEQEKAYRRQIRNELRASDGQAQAEEQPTLKDAVQNVLSGATKARTVMYAGEHTMPFRESDTTNYRVGFARVARNVVIHAEQGRTPGIAQADGLDSVFDPFREPYAPTDQVVFTNRGRAPPEFGEEDQTDRLQGEINVGGYIPARQQNTLTLSDILVDGRAPDDPAKVFTQRMAQLHGREGDGAYTGHPMQPHGDSGRAVSFGEADRTSDAGIGGGAYFAREDRGWAPGVEANADNRPPVYTPVDGIPVVRYPDIAPPRVVPPNAAGNDAGESRTVTRILPPSGQVTGPIAPDREINLAFLNEFSVEMNKVMQEAGNASGGTDVQALLKVVAAANTLTAPFLARSFQKQTEGTRATKAEFTFEKDTIMRTFVCPVSGSGDPYDRMISLGEWRFNGALAIEGIFQRWGTHIWACLFDISYAFARDFWRWKLFNQENLNLSQYMVRLNEILPDAICTGNDRETVDRFCGKVEELVRTSSKISAGAAQRLKKDIWRRFLGQADGFMRLCAVMIAQRLEVDVKSQNDEELLLKRAYRPTVHSARKWDRWQKLLLYCTHNLHVNWTLVYEGLMRAAYIAEHVGTIWGYIAQDFRRAIEKHNVEPRQANIEVCLWMIDLINVAMQKCEAMSYNLKPQNKIKTALAACENIYDAAGMSFDDHVSDALHATDYEGARPDRALEHDFGDIEPLDAVECAYELWTREIVSPAVAMAAIRNGTDRPDIQKRAKGDGKGGGSKGKGKGKPEAREGDWVCRKCGMNNFAFRETCFGSGCDATRPSGTVAVAKAHYVVRRKVARFKKAHSYNERNRIPNRSIRPPFASAKRKPPPPGRRPARGKGKQDGRRDGRRDAGRGKGKGKGAGRDRTAGGRRARAADGAGTAFAADGADSDDEYEFIDDAYVDEFELAYFCMLEAFEPELFEGADYEDSDDDVSANVGDGVVHSHGDGVDGSADEGTPQAVQPDGGGQNEAIKSFEAIAERAAQKMYSAHLASQEEADRERRLKQSEAAKERNRIEKESKEKKKKEAEANVAGDLTTQAQAANEDTSPDSSGEAAPSP